MTIHLVRMILGRHDGALDIFEGAAGARHPLILSPFFFRLDRDVFNFQKVINVPIIY